MLFFSTAEEAPMVRGKNRDILIEKGGELLHAKGYDATGVSEITGAAGVPKGSFYNYFASKEAFALEVLEHYVSGAIDMMESMLNTTDGTHLERLRGLYLQLVAVQSGEHLTRGCMIGNLCQELAGRDDAFQPAIRQTMRRMRQVVENELALAQAAGEIDPDIDVAETTAFISDAWQGAQMRAKASRDTAPMESFVTHVFDRILA
jgi:TetR/AcrR family transcriptional repressor of nem operon